MTARTCRARGSAAVETALVAPILIFLILFVVLAGRVASAKLRVEGAARDAARAASMAFSPGTAAADASSTAAAALASAGITCSPFAVTPSLGSFAPGGTVTVTVQCTVGLSSLAPLPLPGTKTLAASYTVPIDTYRSVR